MTILSLSLQPTPTWVETNFSLPPSLSHYIALKLGLFTNCWFLYFQILSLFLFSFPILSVLKFCSFFSNKVCFWYEEFQWLKQDRIKLNILLRWDNLVQCKILNIPFSYFCADFRMKKYFKIDDKKQINEWRVKVCANKCSSRLPSSQIMWAWARDYTSFFPYIFSSKF